MSELRDAARRAAVFQYIEKRAGELKNQAREELRSLPFGDTVAAKVGEQILAKASWVKGRQKIVVTDEQALLAWVKEHHPDEIIESVNPAFLKTFGAVDGQVHWQGHPVDFMEARESDPYVTVKGNDETPFLVAQLLRSGSVSLDGVQDTPALPEPEGRIAQDRRAAGL